MRSRDNGERMSEIEDIFSNMIKPLENMPKELQISNIALQLALVGLDNDLTPKIVVDYFYEVVKLMRTHKRIK
jgi:hypothetical protein